MVKSYGQLDHCTMKERTPLLRNQKSRIKCHNRLCLCSKSATVIILWTVLIGIAHTSLYALVSTVIHPDNKLKFATLTYPLNIFYFVLTIVALLYPLIGFVSDASCGRLKVVLFCFTLVLLSYLIIFAILTAYFILAERQSRYPLSPAFSVIPITAALTMLIGSAGYQANFIQLGLNQHVSAPSEHLALFIHWAMWSYNVGSTFASTLYQISTCYVTRKYAALRMDVLLIPNILVIVFYIVVLLVSCFKRRWFTTELRLQNPCKIIVKVLAFARKHKYPLRRSAFTYSDDDKPTRLDFAKEIFGGPFTTEQVEDTKSFFKIIALLISLGPVFVVDVQSSFPGLMLFGYHAGREHVADTNGTYHHLLDRCSSWVLMWSGNFKYVSGTLLFPVYIWFIFSYRYGRIPKMFKRLVAGIIMYLLGNFSLLITDLVGHILSNRDSSSIEGNQCIFDANFSGHSYHLGMHWTVMILPSLLLGIAPLVIMTTALEFISAQSPHFMKGLMVGILFTITGLFQMIGALALLPFSAKEFWNTANMRANPPITNCGFGYFLFTFVVAFIGLILFVVVAKKYTYRVRDNKPYNQSQVEEIVSRYLE